ncbi:MAG: substrate-binding domain-containing protein, partial [Bryobacteraceae bacterium]|nr:substrate-binding domain-containing protein [Bryobacteraceae bacterium]
MKELARHLNLSPATVSLVLNNVPAARAIPKGTKERIFAAARRLNYRPNFVARSLRAKRTYAAGVIVPELSDGYSALVLSGVEDLLLKEGYMYLVASHRHRPELIQQYPALLIERCVEGLIAVDTPCERPLPVPVVCVSGHRRVPGVTNIVLNHKRAGDLALGHLVELGHRRIAFVKGQAFSSDTEVRWEALRSAAARFGIEVRPPLVVQLQGESPSPEVGYLAAKKLLAGGERFTALVAFNDISAIGAIRAFREAGLRVPVLIFGCQEQAMLRPDLERRDSFCGLLSIGEALRQIGVQYSVAQTPICYPSDPSFAADLDHFARVCRVVNGIRKARYG